MSTHRESGDIDPITFAVVRHALLAATEEMYWVFKRTAMLPLLYEFNDFGMSLFDHRLNLLADAPGLPIFIGSLETCLEGTLKKIGGPEELEPGDILLNNHPYLTAGQTADAAVIEPIFFKNDLVGYSAMRGHMGDFGAMNLYPCDSQELFQEGTIFPGVKLYRAGKLNRTVTAILEANSRLPDETVGSILAAGGAVRACSRKVVEIFEKYGAETYYATVDALLDHGERVTREVLERIPDGEYVASDLLDDDGVSTEPVELRSVVRITDSSMIVDVTDSAEEQAGPVNCPWGYTLTACRFALKRLTSPELPANSGGYRPLQLIAPRGGIFNPVSPAPVFCSIWTALRLGDMIINSLAEALETRIPAPHSGDLIAVLAYIRDEGPSRTSFFIDLGGIGLGASHDGDGANAVMHACQAGSESMPAELMENRMPVMKRRFELIQDSGGPGRFRGGLGTVAEYQFTGKGAASVIAEKSRAWTTQGMDGGLPSPLRNDVVIAPGTDREIHLGKAANLPIERGDRCIVRAAGGAGYGEPRERNVEQVARDVLNGYVSIQQAESVYGVTLLADRRAVDLARTDELRARRALEVGRGVEDPRP